MSEAGPALRNVPLPNASAYSFHQAALLLERYFASAPPVGTALDAAAERIRFRALDSLAFPPADVAAADTLARPEGGDLVRLTVTFLGLYGPSSPMAVGFTERLLLDDEGGPAIRDFLDVFNHRLLSLLHRAWTKYRYYLRFRGTGQDDVSKAIFALIGHPRPTGHEKAGVRWEQLLPFAGILAMPNASPHVIERVLSHYFAVQVRIEEAVERFIAIPEGQRHRLGLAGNELGRSWTLGRRVRDLSGKFRIWIGPVTRARFDAFAPGGADHGPLFDLVRKLLRDSLLFDVRILLEPDALEAWRLGSPALPLGRLLWLGKADIEGLGVPILEPSC